MGLGSATRPIARYGRGACFIVSVLVFACTCSTRFAVSATLMGEIIELDWAGGGLVVALRDGSIKALDFNAQVPPSRMQECLVGDHVRINEVDGQVRTIKIISAPKNWVKASQEPPEEIVSILTNLLNPYADQDGPTVHSRLFDDIKTFPSKYNGQSIVWRNCSSLEFMPFFIQQGNQFGPHFEMSLHLTVGASGANGFINGNFPHQAFRMVASDRIAKEFLNRGVDRNQTCNVAFTVLQLISGDETKYFGRVYHISWHDLKGDHSINDFGWQLAGERIQELDAALQNPTRQVNDLLRQGIRWSGESLDFGNGGLPSLRVRPSEGPLK